MQVSNETEQDFLALRDRADSAQLATLRQMVPEASHAPCVWLDGYCHLFLSELASHTANLMNNPRISLVLVEDAAAAANAFARKRIVVHGSACLVARDDPSYEPALAEFRRRFGEVMDIIEPLPDFHLFRVHGESGSFVRGFGQAFALSGDKLDRLTRIDPRS